MIRALLIATAAMGFAAVGVAAPPLAGSWTITPSGSAASSGELLFRVAENGGKPVVIKVPVRRGTEDVAIARDVRAAFDSQLRADYEVRLGEGANVLVSDPRGKPTFSIELLESDIDSLRVSVRNIEPAATPTVPEQSTPATTPPPPTPAQPGTSAPPTQDLATALPPADAPRGGAPPADTPPRSNAPAPTAPPATAPGGSSGGAAPAPVGTSPPSGSSSPAAPPNATPPPNLD